MRLLSNLIKRPWYVFILAVLSACNSDNAEELLALVENSEESIVEIRNSDSAVTLATGLTVQLSVTGIGVSGSSLPLPEPPSWRSTSPGVATVNRNGLVTAVSIGSTEIITSLESHVATSVITVSAAELTGFSFDTSALEFNECSTQSITASATYSDGTTSELPNSIEWSLDSDADITLRQNANSAEIDANNSGVGTLTISSGTITESVSITVLDTLSAIDLKVPPGMLIPDQLRTLSAVGTYTDGTLQTIDRFSMWSIAEDDPLNPVVALEQLPTLDYELRGVSLGSALIEISCGGLNHSVPVTVNTVPADIGIQIPVAIGIQIAGGEIPSLEAGETIDLELNSVFSDGSEIPVPSGVTWELTDNDDNAFLLTEQTDIASATLTAAPDLLVEHQATLTATYEDQSTSLVVYALKDVIDTLQSLVLLQTDSLSNEFEIASGSTLMMTQSDSTQLVLNGLYLSGTTRIPATDIIWANTNPLIATITAEGLLNAVGVGSASIIAIADGQQIELPITVVP